MIPGVTYEGPAPQFDIVTEPGHGTGVGDWVVKGVWHGARRVLFIGNAWDCARRARRQERVGA